MSVKSNFGARAAMVLLAIGLPAAQGAGRGQDGSASAVSEPSRPPEDVARDADRRPVDTLAFIGVRPGDRIADYASGSG